MVRLTILRHAKSSWATPGASDVDRVLSERGHEQLVRLSAWLRDLQDKPDACICSPATRTRQTWQGIAQVLPDIEPDYRKRLYPGSIDAYLEEIWGSMAGHLLLIGHNPVCDDLVRSLCAPSGEAYDTLANSHFGTANWATLAFSGDDMQAVGLAKGALEHYVRPKYLSQV